jgi:hypothetical protein
MFVCTGKYIIYNYQKVPGKGDMRLWSPSGRNIMRFDFEVPADGFFKFHQEDLKF